MSLDPARFRPPAPLRNAHVQSVLASSRLRGISTRRVAADLIAGSQELILDSGEGVRLQGFLTRQTRRAQARGLVVLVHGWEGSVDSNYILATGARLLDAGFDAFRLHLRDHGDTHALNRDLFHSCRIDEVVGAVGDLARRVPHRALCIAGYSLGGNFALRVALRAPDAGIDLRHAAAVCPVISPKAGLEAIEAAPWFYQRYFMHKWGRSLRRKQAIFPDAFQFSRSELRAGVRGLTRALVDRYTEFDSLDAYLDGYSVAGDRLAGLQVPASILTAADDPVIPVEDFRTLSLPPQVRLSIAPWGGHCGFLAGLRLDGLAEAWVTEQLAEACPAD